MPKKEAIRRKDRALCDRKLLHRWLYGEPDETDCSEGPEVIMDSNTTTASVEMAVQVDGAIPSPMQSAVVSEIQPFSMANKDNNARDSALWNELWALVRRAEGLPADTGATYQIPLRRTAELLHIQEIVLWRYFWGLQRYKGGKPMVKNGGAVKSVEKALREAFALIETRLPSEHVDANHDAKAANNKAAPSQIQAVPLHTTPTNHGMAAIYDFGDASAAGCQGSDWQYSNRKHASNPVYYLRPGMRGRHIFGATSQNAGRCFEWVLQRSKANCGKPCYVVTEFELNEAGFRKSKRSIRGLSPHEVWNRVFTEELSLAAPNRGAQLCGFEDPSLADLLSIHLQTERKQYVLKPGESLSSRTSRWERDFAASASGAFRKAMESICPSDPALAFTVLRRSASWQAEWLREDDDYGGVLDMPFITGMVDAHNNAPTKELKIGILSLFAPYFPVAVTCSLFSVKPHEVTTAKIHDADAMAGQPLPKSLVERMRLSPRTFAFLHGWCRSSYAVTAGDASSGNLKRLEIRARLYKRYKAMAEEELGVKVVSSDCFNRHMREGFEDDTVDTCCCGGCCDGWTAFSMLRDFISDPEYQFPDRQGLCKRVDAIEQFLKSDYRWKHLRDSSHEAMHCMQHALGSSCAALSEACDHDHVNTCVECNQLPALISELVDHSHNWADAKLLSLQHNYRAINGWGGWHSKHDWEVHGIPVGMVYGSQAHSDWLVDGKPVTTHLAQPMAIAEQVQSTLVLIDSMLEHIHMIADELHRYRAHLVRKHKASQGQMELLSQVSATNALVFIDYKQKVLPAENKEAQSKTFGKKGKSLFGMVAMFKLPEGFAGKVPEGIDIDGDYAISYFRACADDSDQDYLHSVQCTEIGCKFLKQNYPWLTHAMLYSDGAGNFRSLSYELLMAETIAAVGLQVTCHLLPEAGDGKDRVDRDFAGVNKLFWSYLKQPGASMQNAVEMTQALEYGKRDGDGVVNCAVEIARLENKSKASAVDTEAFTRCVGKARDNMYYTKFEYDSDSNGSLTLSGARFYAYYEMGEGVHLSAATLASLWPSKVQFPSAKIVHGATLENAAPQLQPKVELSKSSKASKQKAKVVAQAAQAEAAKQEAAAAKAAKEKMSHM